MEAEAVEVAETMEAAEAAEVAEAALKRVASASSHCVTDENSWRAVKTGLTLNRQCMQEQMMEQTLEQTLEQILEQMM